LTIENGQGRKVGTMDTPTVHELQIGERVRFTTGPLGIIAADHLYRFVAEYVSSGDEGEVVPAESAPMAVPSGWVLVKIEPGLGWFRTDEGEGEVVDRYVPVHPSMLELA